MQYRQVFDLLYHPVQEWESIREHDKAQPESVRTAIFHIVLTALIPPVCLLIGTTQLGWSIAGRNFVTLTFESALPIAVAFYFAILVVTACVAYSIYWMEQTFGSQATMGRCITFTALTATPLYFAGFAGLLPIVWLAMLVVTAAVAYCVYLLYVGLPVYMEVPPERGFIFASSILTVGLVMLVSMMAVTVILWSYGFTPQTAGA